MGSYENLEYTVEDPVAIIRMNRPKALNAMTMKGFGELRDAFGQAEADPSVVGIVLTGTGRGFCAGADMTLLAGIAQGSSEQLSKEEASAPRPVGDLTLGESRRHFAYLTAIRKPIVAAVNGVAAGAGFVMALLSDIRIASESAAFTSVFPKRGLISEHGVAWILPRVIGTSRALDLLWSGRKVGASEAERIGLVDRVVPDDQLIAEARAYIEGLAKTVAPWSLMVTKRLVYQDWARGLDTALDETDRKTAESLSRGDLVEGVAAFLEKRAPRFERLKLED